MKILLDLRGCIMHSLHQGIDLDGIKTEKGAKLNGVGHCIENFINNYITVPLEFTRLNDIIAVKDSGNDYRKSLYPLYKANRIKDPEKVDQQIVDRVRECEETIFTLLKSLGVPTVHAAGIEADDIIAYLVQKLPDPCIIYTVDQDLLQLSSPTCAVYLKGVFNGEGYPLYNGASPKVLLTTVLPRHVTLCKSLVGDTSDNYGGVKGFGPAKFKQLLDNYELDGLDELVNVVATEDYNGMLKEALDLTGDKTLKMLYDNKEDWRLGWKLANLAPELVEARQGNKFNRLQHTKRVPNPEAVKALLTQHGCKHLIHKLKAVLPTQTLITADNIGKFPLDWFVAEFNKSPLVSLDWETTDQIKHQPFKEAVKGREFVDMLSSTITGSGFTFGENLEHTVYLSYDHADTANLSRQWVLDLVEAVPEGVPVVIQNVLFEINVLKSSLGASIANCHDTKVMSSYVNENSPNGLKESSKEHLNYNQIKYKDVIDAGKTMSDYSAEHVFQYGADDPLVTAHLYEHYKLIMQLEGTFDFFVENENTPLEILSDGFLAGVTIDWEELDRQATDDRATYNSSLAKLRELIEANQTGATFKSGVSRLFAEGEEEVRVKVADKFWKSRTGAEEDLMAADFEQDQLSDEATSKFYNLVEHMVKYTPLVTIEKELDFALTASGIKPVLIILGLPAVREVNTQSKVLDYANANRGVSAEADLFLDLMVTAAGSNQTSAAKLSQGKGRAHPDYTEFEKYGKSLLGTKSQTTGSELNLNSPPQMKALLYGMLDLPIRMRKFEVSKTRAALGLTSLTSQANEDAIITALAEDCVEFPWKAEALNHLWAARKCATRLSLFYDTYPKWKHPIDGMIHPQINSCGTETRRPTGSSPNPLQWPKRGDGVKFRQCILPNAKLGHDLIVSIDWSQQELRIAGALSMDEAFLDCYIGSDVEHVLSDEVKELLGEKLLNKFLSTETKDIHIQTATGLLKWAYNEVIAALEGSDVALAKKAKVARTSAKPINFGSAYGIGAAKIARQLICPVETAKQYLKDKKDLYHQFEDWREKIVELVTKQGYVATALGNRRHVHTDVLSSDDKLRSGIYRQIVNYLIQGVAADNLKRTLAEIYNQQILPRTGGVLIAPIYDEVVFSVHHTHAVDLIMSVHAIMVRDIPGMAVPMLAEPSLGVNFGDQIEIGRFPDPEKIEEAVWKAFDLAKIVKAA